MKQTMKKCLTLLLALALLFTMAVPAAAATPYDKTITFTDVAQGDTVTAYKLVGYKAGYNAYDPHTDFEGYVKHYHPDDDITLEAFLGGLSAQEMKALLAGYVNLCQIGPGGIPSHALPADPVTGTADASNQVTLTLEPGYYVVLGSTNTTNDRTYKLTSVFVQMKNDNVKLIAGGTDITADPTMALKHTTGPNISVCKGQ